MSDYDYRNESSLWENDGILYDLNDKNSYGYQENSTRSYSAVVVKYVQLMKEQGITTVVAMNIYLAKNDLWNEFESIQRMNTYSSGHTFIGVSREAYSEITALYRTDDVIHTRLEKSKILG